MAEHRRSAKVRVRGGHRPSRSDAAGALDADQSRPDAQLSVRGRTGTTMHHRYDVELRFMCGRAP